MGEHGRWAERQVTLPDPLDAPGDPERAIERALELPNAVWRFQGLTPTFTCCLMLVFRYTAVSDEKREGLIWLGFNLATGAVVDEIVPRLRTVLASGPGMAGSQRRRHVLRRGQGGIRPCSNGGSDRCLTIGYDGSWNRSCAPCGGALSATATACTPTMTICAGRRASGSRRWAATPEVKNPKPSAQRERLRIAAIEREYHAKLDDLRHNYALRITVEWVQALKLYLPVQRFEVLVRRRKGERLIRLDWHPLVRLTEPPPCDWGMGLDRVRLVCDEKLHLTEPSGQDPCPSCGKAWCRACHPARCPRCGETTSANDSGLMGI